MYYNFLLHCGWWPVNEMLQSFNKLFIFEATVQSIILRKITPIDIDVRNSAVSVSSHFTLSFVPLTLYIK